MKTFPVELIQPTKGVLNALIFENTFTGIPKTLFFSMDIPLKPIDMSVLSEYETNKKYRTAFRLDFIQLNITDLKDLENKTFSFPINPDAGYIDGSVYMFAAHNMIYTTSIRFGTFKNQKIPVHLTLQIDFEMEGTGYALTDFLNFKTELKLGELVIEAALLNPSETNLNQAKTFVQSFIKTDKFDTPFIDFNGIKLKMKV
jgi:hypothetical protein